MATAVTPLTAMTAPRRTRAFGVGTRIALGVLLIMILASITASWIAPHDPLATDASSILQSPSADHLLGTDQNGRDVLSRLIHGGTSAFGGTLVAVAVMALLGIPWGLIAGYAGGAVDQLLMRLTDAFLSVPGLVLAVAITAVIGPGLFTSMAAVGVVYSPSVAVLLRSSIVPIRHSEYVLVSRSLGVGNTRAALRHVLPNAFAPVLVQLCSLASFCLIIQAGLSFIGLGQQPPSASWGADLALAYHHFTATPTATIFPGLMVVTAAFCLSQVGDGLRAALDRD